MYLRKFLCLLLSAGSFTCSLAQNTNATIDSLSAKIVTGIRAHEKAQAILVTDKAVYKAGEFIWFKAFLLNNVSGKISAASKFLFVDVVDEKDAVIKRVILDAANKQLHSKILLPDTLSGGYYWLRAYTKQMVLNDSNSAAVKALYVFNKAGTTQIAKPLANKNMPHNDTPAIHFFAEGGTIITGINSVVALQTVLGNTPFATTVTIKDNRDTVVAKFETNKDGLGKFEFEPSGYRRYKAIINWDGKDYTQPLPAFNYFLGQLSVSKQQGNYKLRVLLGDSIYRKDAQTYVIGISKDSIIFSGIGEGQYEINIAENRIPEGVATFYLFNKNQKLLSERSIYVANDNVNVGVSTDKNIYEKHEKVNLSFSITDDAKHPIPSLVTIAVADSAALPQSNCDAATTLEAKDLNDLYLATNTCFTDDERDLLMLTKTNTYDDLLQPPKETPPATSDSLLFVRGKIAGTKSTAEGKVVTLISSGGDGMFDTDTTDAQGNFKFALDTYADSTAVGIEVKDANNRALNADVVLDSLHFPDFKTPAALKHYFASGSKTAINTLNNYYKKHWTETNEQLPPVHVKDSRKPVDFDESKRVSPFSPIISGDALDGRTSVDNLILRISGFSLMNGYLISRGLTSIRTPNAASEPLLLIDGAIASTSPDLTSGIISPVLSYLKTLNPKDIDFIEVLKDGSSANYGVRGANGVILVNMATTGRNFKSNDANKMHIFYLKGISKPALYPTFIYNAKEAKSNTAQDLRSTLFWSGNYLTENAANAQVSFYTADVAATYVVTITGITTKGDIIYKTMSFKVGK